MEISEMPDKELLNEYNEMRNRVDGIIESGGIGTKDIRYMYDLLDELYKRQDR